MHGISDYNVFLRFHFILITKKCYTKNRIKYVPFLLCITQFKYLDTKCHTDGSVFVKSMSLSKANKIAIL